MRKGRKDGNESEKAEGRVRRDGMSIEMERWRMEMERWREVVWKQAEL